MNGAHHTAGFRCIHERSQCKRPHEDLVSPWVWSAICREWNHRYQQESKISKRGQLSNCQVVGPETRFGKDSWEIRYFMIFWKSWKWPLYSREFWQYWLCLHLVAETSTLTFKNPKSALQYFRLWMWRQGATQHQSCSSAPTNYRNSNASGSKIENTVITAHLSQPKIRGPLWSMSCKYQGHFNIGPCGCWGGIQSHCITFSQCTMSCSIIWMAWCDLCLRRRINAR